MCADIHTKEFPPSRLAYWTSARQNISVLDPAELEVMIGLPGRGWLNWTENPGRYIRKQTHLDPWAEDGGLRSGANAPQATQLASPLPLDDPHTPTHNGATLPQFAWLSDEGNPTPLKVAGDCVGLGTAFEVARRLMSPGIKGLSMSETDDALRNLVLNEFGFDSIASDATNTPASFTKAQADLYVCGFPCQPYSSLGQRLGDGDPRTALLDHVIGYIRQRRPRTFVLENVRGFLTTQDGTLANKLRRSIREIADRKGAPPPTTCTRASLTPTGTARRKAVIVYTLLGSDGT